MSTQKLNTGVYNNLFIVTKTWKQQTCLSVGECTNWYIQIIESYSALKITELSSHEKTAGNLNTF